MCRTRMTWNPERESSRSEDIRLGSMYVLLTPYSWDWVSPIRDSIRDWWVPSGTVSCHPPTIDAVTQSSVGCQKLRCSSPNPKLSPNANSVPSKFSISLQIAFILIPSKRLLVYFSNFCCSLLSHAKSNSLISNSLISKLLYHHSSQWKLNLIFSIWILRPENYKAFEL